jgi:hypothetical protein
MEWPIPLLFEEQTKTDNDDMLADQEEVYLRHAKDRSALAVQKVFGVRIRNVLSGSRQASYRLEKNNTYQ